MKSVLSVPRCFSIWKIEACLEDSTWPRHTCCHSVGQRSPCFRLSQIPLQDLLPLVIMILSRETQLYRQDARQKGNFLTPKQREDLVKPYLPAPLFVPSPSTPRRRMSQPIRTFLRIQLHILVFTVIHTLFSVYIRLRQTYHILLDRVFAILYYHHRAPELIRQDVKNLNRLPEHLSVISELKGDERGTAGLEALLDEVAEIAAWCTCTGIPMLSIYEKTGMAPRSSTARGRVVLTNDRYLEGIPSCGGSSGIYEITCLFWQTHTLTADASASYAVVAERGKLGGTCFDVLSARLASA